MSSFIPSSKHFNSIEKSVIYLTQNNNFYFPYSFKNVFPILYDKRKYTQDAIDSVVVGIIDTLRELTSLCVSLQYKHHYEGTLDNEIQEQTQILIKEKKQFTQLNNIALYKALSCLSYQIETEHLSDLRKLTQDEENAMFFIKEMKAVLCENIVSSLPNYEAAKWEIN